MSVKIPTAAPGLSTGDWEKIQAKGLEGLLQLPDDERKAVLAVRLRKLIELYIRSGGVGGAFNDLFTAMLAYQYRGEILGKVNE